MGDAIVPIGPGGYEGQSNGSCQQEGAQDYAPANPAEISHQHAPEPEESQEQRSIGASESSQSKQHTTQDDPARDALPGSRGALYLEEGIGASGEQEGVERFAKEPSIVEKHARIERS
jgi:hypothetical protein